MTNQKFFINNHMYVHSVTYDSTVSLILLISAKLCL